MKIRPLAAAAAIGIALGAAAPGDAGERSREPGPVMLDLGPVEPTPEPTPPPARKLRLVSSITIHNKPDGETLFAFEVTDVARSEIGEIRVLAAKQYSLLEKVEGKRAKREKVRALRGRIMEKLRALEHDLLELAEELGPPEPPQPISVQHAPAGRR